MNTSPSNVERFAGRRVLVTGAGGFIGSHIADRFAQEGALVGGLSRSLGRLAEIKHKDRVMFLPCDLKDETQTRHIVRLFAPEIVFHYASLPDAEESFTQSQECAQSNVMGTLHLLDALRHFGPIRLIYGDSTKVYGSTQEPYGEHTPLAPNSSYAITKAAAWQLCQLYSRLYGFAVVSVRPTLNYGPRQGKNLLTFIVEKLLAGATEISLDGGAQTRDPLYIDDTVDALVAVAERIDAINGRVVNLGGGQELSVRELAEIIVEIHGSKRPVICRPERMRPTELLRSTCDISEASRMLDWRPRVTLREGIRMTIDYIQKTVQESKTPPLRQTVFAAAGGDVVT